MQVRGAMEKYPPYQSIFSRISYGESQMLDKAFYEEEVRRLCLSFEQQVYFLIRICYKSCFMLLLQTCSWNFGAILCSFMVLYFYKSILALQFHYAVFFAYIRLREQEIRNLMWISECVAQNQKSRVHDSVVFIF
jgi:V-type H+-transporting ATPase subunit d